ncbi:DUF1120 domain-containing protein [Pseudomonas sp. SDO528_S397]
MKTFPALLLTTLIATASSTVSAASSVDLTVKGLITPSACTPGLSAGGAVDYGKVSAKDLSPTASTHLGYSVLDLTVACDAATLMAFEAFDNRPGSAPEPTDSFGLGLVDGHKLGSYSLRMLDPVADGVVVQTIASDDRGLTWFAERTIIPLAYQSVASASDASAPIPVQNLQMGLRFSTYIAPTQDMDLSNEITLDGSATLQIVYL